MVATIPMWIMMEINQNELDVGPGARESKMEQKRPDTRAGLIEAAGQTAAGAAVGVKANHRRHFETIGACWLTDRSDGSAPLRNDPGHD